MNYYLFTAYTLIWTVLFIYIVALHRKQNETESKLKQLESQASGNRMG